MTQGTIIHITPADKREGIADMGEGRPCDRQGCPGPDGWEVGFGLAGGGYGPYHFCNVCDEVKEKDCEPNEESNP